MDLSSPSAEGVTDIFYELLLRNDFDELTKLSEWVNEISSKLKISSRGVFRLELILSEAVTNIIENAYEDDAEHRITLTLKHCGHTFKIQIRDDGLPFDPLKKPEVVFPNSLEEAEIGGLGIHLIRKYADECHYQRDEDQNILTVIIHDSDAVQN
jgi:anti-sigma regulatory factor (Ser/Thr protein kinase)